MHMVTWMEGQPSLDLRVFMRSIVINDQMDIEVFRDVLVHVFEES